MRLLQLLCIIAWLGVGSLSAQSYEQKQNQKSDTIKGSYFTVSGSVGSSSFDYKLNSLGEKGSRSGAMGYGIDLKYSYFFNSHWGVSTGVGISHYGSKGKLKGSLSDEKYIPLGNQIDNDDEGRPRDFELRARLTNLEEKQTAYTLDIPLMLSYQTRFGEEQRWGMYGGLGVKLQIPVSSKFKIQKGSESQFNVSGYYKDIPTDMGSPSNPPVPQHGYGTITNPNETLKWNDDSKLKLGVAGTAELGVMVDIGSGMDLMLGGYVDYGFTDVKKNGDQKLFTAPSVYHDMDYHTSRTPYIGKGIKYNGMLNSDVTDKVKLISFGGKVALRFKL